MAIRFDDIGNRLKAFRLGSGLNADEIAERLGISRAALYRFEKGELAKIETLERLSELLGVSVPTLLGVGMEYIPSALSYFERLRQIEETAEHIVVLAGPVSYVLTSPDFDDKLADALCESVPADAEGRDRTLQEVAQIMAILRQRKATFHRRRPSVVNLISAPEIERFIRDGLVGRPDLPDPLLAGRRAQACAEVLHLATLLEDQPMGIQVAIVPDALPRMSFHIIRQRDREMLVLSPFRLGEQPNIRVGVAMITAAPEAVALHQAEVERMWRRAQKGPPAAQYLRALVARQTAHAPPARAVATLAARRKPTGSR